MKPDSTTGRIDQRPAFPARMDSTRYRQTAPAGAATLARGLRLLEVFQHSVHPLTHGELASLSGFTPPTVTRLATALERLGYLRRCHDRRWELTPQVLALGHPKLIGSRVRRIAQPYLLELARLGDVSVAIAEPSGATTMVVIEACTVSAGAAVRLDVGERRDMVSSAVGFAYLSAVPKQERASLLATLRTQYRQDWKAVSRRLRTASKELADRGFIYASGESAPLDRVVAVPLAVADRFYVINCVAAAFAVTEERMLAELGPRLVVLGQHIEGLT